HHLVVTQSVFGVLDAFAKILDDLLHEQRGVGAPKAAVAVDDVMACTGQRVDHRQVGAAADGVHEHQHRIRRFGLRLEKVAFQDDQLGDTAVDVPRTGDVLVSNQIRDAVVLVLDGYFGCRHQCCPKSFARTSADGTSRRRVSIAITDQSTESYSSNLRRARSRAFSGAPWCTPCGACEIRPGGIGIPYSDPPWK